MTCQGAASLQAEPFELQGRHDGGCTREDIDFNGLVWQHACRNEECLARSHIVLRDSRGPVKLWGAAG